MPDSDEEESTAHQRSALAALGSRKRLFSFGKDESEEADDSEGPAPRGMLASLASRAGPAEEPEQVPAPSGRSMLSLAGPAPASPKGSTAATVDDAPLGHLVAHSTLGELAGQEEHPVSSFPIERAILISLGAHVLLLVLLLVAPTRNPAGSKGDFLAALMPDPKDRDDTPIPVIFQEAPGPARANPNRSPLSDADRRAGGGDRAKPKSSLPFVPPSPGIAGLAPGPRSPRVAGSEVPSRKGASAEAERRTAQAEPAQSPSSPSEFPSASRPQTSLGPRETTHLAGLDSAIREAARGTVGGEGGTPDPNPGGGFVDSGPISFDTTWYDWGAYAAEMVRRIKLHWEVPELARLGWKGRLTVRFFILADGRVADAKIIRGSGIPPFDFAAFQAITKSSPFRPLPADLHEEREGVTVTFFYNLRPETEEAGGAR